MSTPPQGGATPPSFGSGPQSFGPGASGPSHSVEPPQSRDSQKPAPAPSAPYTDEPVYETPAPAEKSGISAFVWTALILGALILILLLVFVMQNNQKVDISYFAWTFSMPLGVALLLAAIAGLLVAGIVGSVRIMLLGRKLKRAQKRS